MREWLKKENAEIDQRLQTVTELGEEAVVSGQEITAEILKVQIKDVK